MRDKFLIGELSRVFNISTDTLRYYDRVGLLKPEYNPENNYRYYSVKSFFLLSRILFLKSLDISIGEIKEYMQNQKTDSLLSLLKGKEEEIDVTISRLINLRGKIRSKIRLIEDVAETAEEIRIEYFPRRQGVFINIDNPKDDEEIKRAFINYEGSLAMSSWLIEGQIYTSISKTNLIKGRFDHFHYFIEIMPENDIKGIEILDEGDYACIIICGPYDKFDYYYRKLLEWIEENDYEITGHSIEKNIVDYGFSDSEEEYISEIQIPVQRRKNINLGDK